MRLYELLRGALLLPIFFYTILLNAEEPLLCAFYNTPLTFTSFLKSEKNEYTKDIFIHRYHLPLSGRKYKYDFSLKKVDSFTDDKENYYLYIKCDKNCSFSVLFGGIKNGVISINGSKRGDIDIDSAYGYSLMTLNLSKGIYFFSLLINEKYEEFPLTMLSDSIVNVSDKNGFNKDSKASATLRNINTKNKLLFEDAMFKRFCFPYCGFSSGNISAEINILNFSGYTASFDKLPVIVLLSRVAYDRNIADYLKKLGFTSDDIAWWEIKSKNGFCKE